MRGSLNGKCNCLNSDKTRQDQYSRRKLADIPEISEVYSVGGSIDVIAIIRVRDNEGISDLVTHKMLHINGIERTETMIAFKAYSKHDLEGLFSIGLEH